MDKAGIKNIILFLLIITTSTNAQFDAKKVYDKCVNGVVYIATSEGFGTGFFINPDGWILTNLHVISDQNGNRISKSLIKVIPHGNNKHFTVQGIKISDKYDLALLKIDYLPRVIIPITEKNDINVGEEAVAIGHPSGLKWSQTKGTVSQSYKEYIQTDITINPGNSGGPILNARGQLIGIATLKFLNIESTNIGIKANVVKDFLSFEDTEYSTEPLIQSAERENLDNEWELIKNKKREIESEKNNLETEIIKFARLKEESLVLIEKADELREQKITLDKKQKLLDTKENDLRTREVSLENKINQYRYIFPEHFSLEILSNNGYFVGKDIKSGNFLIGAGATLLYRFDINKVNDNDTYAKANRFGVQYFLFRNYGDEKYKIFSSIQQFGGLILDFSEALRVGGGVELTSDKKDFSDRLLYFTIGIYFKPNQFTFLLDTKAFSDQKLKDSFYTLGLSLGYSGNFLRW